ncbi:MAG: translation initiation factor IF-2 [candidate division Zixibacteria bacterium]|nr:translation initiation factor IF-2 [candidate division Zixibacteria bacterium]
MGKKRLYEVAKEYNISSEAIVKLVRELGFTDVKSHMSTATDEMLTAIASKFSLEKESVKQEIDRRKKIQREVAERDLEVFEEEEAAGTEKIVSKAQVIERQAKAAVQLRKKKRDKKKKKRHSDISAADVKAAVKKTMAKIDLGKRIKKYKRREKPDGTVVEEEANVIQVTEYMSLAELATAVGAKPADLIAKCMELGMMVTINQRLDLTTIETLALEYGLEIEEVKEIGVEEEEEVEAEEDMKPRAPIVTVMGHVDHGKTSLLDSIRKTNVAAGETGLITQHIGAYQVTLPQGNITFLDTPGHEAFTAMRARGADITDIVVLVVAADDGVMPQTIEAIDHARAADVPIIVAVNKIDKPGAKPEQVKQQLAGRGVSPEEWGGKNIFVEVSAKTGQGVDKLLEMILLQAELLELKSNPDHLARATVVEAKLDKGRGVVTTIIMEKGMLHIGDPIVAGIHSGRVRALINDRGERRDVVLPGEPAQVVGLAGVPQAGDSFMGVESEAEAREISIKRQQIRREHEHRQVKRVSLMNVYDQIKEGERKDLNIVIKGDVDGSVQVLRDTLEKISNEEVRVNVIHYGVGAITESDILLAAASDAIVIGFHVRPDSRAREVAAREKIDVRLYTIIYEAESDIRKALEGMLEPDKEERITGVALVKDTFRVPKIGVIAGCYVQSGTIHRSDHARIIRDSISVYSGAINSLRRFKDDAREVPAGMECGIKIENFDDVKAGDLIEAFETVEVARKL